jgi:hypothetical protein
MPQKHLLWTLERISYSYQKHDEVKRGEKLLLWMDSLGLGEVGFNLSIGLPERNCFRHYGKIIHELWEEVRSRGGQLRPLIRILRKELRTEILRVKKEREFLRGAYAQVLMMVSLVYLYLIAFSQLIGISFPKEFWPTLFLFQGFGVFLFFLLLKKLRKVHFEGLKFLSLSLLELKLISQRGSLGSFVLRQAPRQLQKGEVNFLRRLEEILEQWRSDSRIQIQYLTELEEDLEFLRESHLDRFMAQLKISSFMWSLIFVLPLLFGASLFGLYELTVV